MSVPVKVGSELLVNTQTAGDQAVPRITELSNGGFVITWRDESGTLGDNSNTSIKAQIYAADGAKVGSEFLVNTYTDGRQSLPAITGLSGGGFVVTWQDASGTLGDASGSSIKAQVYAADGSKVGSEFLVNTRTDGDQNQSTITGLSNGGFVVTWLDDEGNTPAHPNTNVKAQLYDANGNKVGSEVLVNGLGIERRSPTVVPMSDGGYVIAWNSYGGLAFPFHSVEAQVFAADGGKIGSKLVIDQMWMGGLTFSIASLSAGGFVVTWSNSIFDGSQQAIDGQVYDATGGKVGSKFIVSQLDHASGYYSQAISSLGDGGFVVTWLEYGGTNIMAQRLAADGSKVGSPFIAVAGVVKLYDLATTGLSDGRFVVTWQTSDGDGSGSAVKAQIFTLGPPPAPAIVSVTDDVGSQTGVLADGGTSDDTNLTVRISTGSNFVGDTIQLLDGETAVGNPLVLTAADIARGYVDIQTGALADGPHAISAQVTDVTGDAGAPAAPFLVTVDSSPATVDNSIVAVTGIVPDSSNLPHAAVNGRVGPAAAGLTVSVYDGARLVGTTTADGDGHWTLAGVTLTNGRNTLSATVTDAGGATVSSEVFSVTVLTTAAAVSTTSDANYIVLGGGTLEIGFGIDMTGSVVIGNGGVELDYGNTAETVVASGGVQNVYYGGVSNGTVVEAGGYQGVYFGTANGTQLSGSQQVVQATANDTTVLDGGTQFAGAGGEVVRSVVHQGGSQYIDANATATDTIVDGGSQFVSGLANGTIVSGGGSQFVYGAADQTMIGDGGAQLVFGSVTNTTIANGGEQKVYSEGTATGTTVNTAGTQLVWGTAVNTTINGGAQFLLGTATDTTIIQGSQYVQAGGSAVDTTIGAGAVEFVYAGGTANGVTFAGPYGYLGLEQSSAFTGTISGWQDNDFIDLGDILFSGSGTALAYSDNADHAGGVLTISDGTHLATLNLLGQYMAADFALSSDGHGGTLVTNPAVVEQNLLAPALAA
jgi:autotransporter passenger strand-loop-strand repeat protein